jgi:hypothetical protein
MQDVFYSPLSICGVQTPTEGWAGTIPETWDEDTTQPQPLLYLDAATYRVETLFDVTPSPRLSPEYLVSPSGNFAYINAILSRHEPLKLLGKTPGLVAWNGDVVIPMLIDMQRQSRSGQRFPLSTPERHRATWGNVWMSLTPSEMITQRSGVRRASGKVVIGGLGLGWLLKKVCEKEEVREMVVVEISQEVLDWYGYDLGRRYAKVTGMICNDVYKEIGRHGDCQYLLDIWPIYQGASMDKRLRHIRRKLGRRLWAWGSD